MPVVSDFEIILGDHEQATITNNDLEVGFGTGGRHAAGAAFISFMVGGLTRGTADVFVNGTHVGSLLNNDGHWQSQTVTLNGGTLNNGNNRLRVSNVAGDPFSIRSVICHFKQDV